MKLDELFEKGRKFLENVEDSDNVILVHHMDGDGYCSGALVLYALHEMGKENIDVEAATNSDLERMVKEGELGDYDKVIIVDIDAPYMKKEFSSFEGRILIIDHHSVRDDMNSDNIVYINPQLEDEKLYQPASYVIFQFLSSFADMEEKEWVAVLGTISDMGFEDCRDLLDKWVDVETKEELTETNFWEASNLLYASIIVKTKSLIDSLLEYDSLSEIKKDEKVLEANEKFENVYEDAKEEFWENSENIENLVISRIDPPFKRISSALATNLGLDNMDKIIMVLEKRGDKYKISGRYQGEEVHLGKIMNKCANLGGGGHQKAAGGMIDSSYYEDFKKCVLREISIPE